MTERPDREALETIREWCRTECGAGRERFFAPGGRWSRFGAAARWLEERGVVQQQDFRTWKLIDPDALDRLIDGGTLDAKFKVGECVIVSCPSDRAEWPSWTDHMDVFDGQTCEILSRAWSDNHRTWNYYVAAGDNRCYARESWLTPATDKKPPRYQVGDRVKTYHHSSGTVAELDEGGYPVVLFDGGGKEAYLPGDLDPEPIVKGDWVRVFKPDDVSGHQSSAVRVWSGLAGRVLQATRWDGSSGWTVDAEHTERGGGLRIDERWLQKVAGPARSNEKEKSKMKFKHGEHVRVIGADHSDLTLGDVVEVEDVSAFNSIQVSGSMRWYSVSRFEHYASEDDEILATNPREGEKEESTMEKITRAAKQSTRQLAEAAKDGVKIAGAQKVAHGVRDLIKSQAGDAYPEFFSTPLGQKVEIPLLITMLHIAANAFHETVPHARGVQAACSYAMTGEAAQLSAEVLGQLEPLFAKVAMLAPKAASEGGEGIGL